VAMVAGAELETINRTTNYDPGWLALNLKICVELPRPCPTQSTLRPVLNTLQPEIIRAFLYLPLHYPLYLE